MIERFGDVSEKRYWEEPTLARKFIFESVMSTASRYSAFLNSDNEEQLDDSDMNTTGKLSYHTYMSLKDINAAVKEAGIDEKDVVFTASFSDDYLTLEVVHVKKLSEQEQQEDLKAQVAAWKKQQKKKKYRELKEIEDRMESLKRQKERLKKDA